MSHPFVGRESCAGDGRHLASIALRYHDCSSTYIDGGIRCVDSVVRGSEDTLTTNTNILAEAPLENGLVAPCNMFHIAGVGGTHCRIVDIDESDERNVARTLLFTVLSSMEDPPKSVAAPVDKRCGEAPPVN